MRRVTFLFVAVAAMFATAEPKKLTPPPKRIAEHLGARTVGILSASTKCEVFRIEEGALKKDEESLHGYRILSRVDAPREDFANEFAAIAFDAKSWDLDMHKMCEFNPGVALRIWKDEDYVDILLCFSCDEWGWYEKPKKDEKDSTPKIDNNDAARPALLKLAKEAFPKDEVIKGLK